MTESVRITVLVENTALGPCVRGEHGLAFWIETESRKILFDTGQTPDVLKHNARCLGIELASADALVLSHGHYDHTGGLEEVMAQTGPVPLFLHPGALVRRFSRQKTGSVNEIGAPASVNEGYLQAHASTVTWTTRATTITDGIRVSGQVPRETEYEDTGGDFYLDENCSTADPIADDQALFFDTLEGTVVLLGCGHAGVVNTLRLVQRLTDGRPIHAVLGGMHLVTASRNRMNRTVEAFRKLGVSVLAPAHCTGARAQARIASEFPDLWKPCHVGSQFTFLRSTNPTPA